MKQNKYLRRICLLMLTMLLTLSGCKAGQGGNDAESEGEANAVSEEGFAFKGDYNIFDRSLTEGKMAVYYLCSGYDLPTWTGTSTQGGDAILFILPDGTTVLNDCGHQAEGASIVAKLQKLGIEKLDHFILSHGHGDHVGGFSIIARYIEIGHIYLPPEEVMARSARQGIDFMKQVEELGIPCTNVSEGDTFTLGKDVNVKVYNPPIGFGTDTNINLNESSLVLKLTYGESSYLVNGDIGNNPDYGYKTEDALVEKYGSELKADVSKVGHHGSDKTKSSDLWRAAVDPKIYVATTPYVRDEVEHFKNVVTGALSLTTALDGDILVSTTGDGTYEVYVSKDRTTDYYGTTGAENGYLKVE
ncbi:MAG: MBL fold metallo-hydrolase [Tyzzerella sp.]|nr:MBL fold metallo-hydrolase [Tyzzerella sp.]